MLERRSGHVGVVHVDDGQLLTVGGHRDRGTLAERIDHGLESGDTRFVDEAAAVIARSANGADAEPPRGDGVDLAVAML